MLQILAFIVVIVVAVAIIKAVGGTLLRFFGRILKFLGTVIWLIFFGPSALCERIVFYVAKFLHIQGPVYLLLGICAPWYYLFAHLPYSFKEMCIKEKEFFRTKKEERFKTIGMAASLFLTAVLLIVFTEEEPIGKATIASFVDGYSFYLVSSFLYSVYKMIAWIRANLIPYKNYVAWKKWTKEKAPHFVDTEVQEKVESLVSNFSVPSGKGRKTFTTYNMVYGRATAFLSYFGRNTETDEPLLFSPYMSPSEEELREYGILISDRGIYISQYEKDDIEIPFGGLWRVIPMRQADSSSLESLTMDYGLDDTVRLESSKDYDLEKIQTLLKAVMAAEIPLAFLRGQVATELEELLREPEKRAATEAAQQQFDMQRNLSDIGKAAEMGGIGAGLEASENIRTNEIKNYMDGPGGGGYAAEYGNNAIDRLLGNKVENLAQQLDPQTGRQIKGGADRMVNGVQIQAKYYQTASQSIGEAFKHKQALYINPDGTMMQIEVPKGQGKEAIELMKKRIKTGQVPGETNPDNAKKYVREGYFTYFQANNIAIAGTIEGLMVDSAQGIVCSLPGAGFSSIITFASAVWNGHDLKDAAKSSVKTGLLTVGKGALMYTATMQLSRDKIVNFLRLERNKSGILRSFGSFKNPVRGVADKAASSISSSKVAKSALGKKIRLNEVTGTKLIGGTVTAAVVFGPDICRAFQGKISGAQLTKNALVSAAGMVGSAVGGAIVGGATGGIGAFAGVAGGGAAASAGVKKLLDKFIEDDAVKMFRIVREEFLDLVMLFSFSKEEFDGIVSQTLAREDMPKILQNMYQSGEPEEYIRVILNSAIQETLGRRKKITNEMYVQGMQNLLLEAQGA
ncbi:MAG: hypothetical protein IKA80_03370 [Spirochaetaceae bacterium]|nr:hypothetical protein [Spirochaetaceae bacterium]